MGFKGKIEDLPILDVIQYLNAGGKTGTLILEHGDDKAYVYFQKGGIVHALSPHRMNLGDILLQNKLISLRDLKAALVHQKDTKKSTPIGRILVDMGILPDEKLKEAVLSQIKLTIGRLIKWKEGEFEFKNNEIEAVDDINMNPTERILESDVNTQSLLMDAVVSMDQPVSGKETEGSPASAPAAGKSVLPETAPPADLSKSDSRGTGEGVLSGKKMGPPEGIPAPSPDQSEPGGKVPPGKLSGGPAAALPEKTPTGGKTPGVLVFSEDGVFKNLLRTILGNNGLRVVTPGTIEECLSVLKKIHEAGEFSIVFIEDGSKPGDRERHRPGMRVLREKERAGWDFPLVILLNEMKQDEVWEFYNAGARAVLPKPARETSEGDQFIRSIEKLGELILKKTRFLQSERNENSPG